MGIIGSCVSGNSNFTSTTVTHTLTEDLQPYSSTGSITKTYDPIQIHLAPKSSTVIRCVSVSKVSMTGNVSIPSDTAVNTTLDTTIINYNSTIIYSDSTVHTVLTNSSGYGAYIKEMRIAISDNTPYLYIILESRSAKGNWYGFCKNFKFGFKVEFIYAS